MSALSAKPSTATTVTVPLLDLKAQYREIERDVMDAIAKVCTGQTFILGENVKVLEERIAAYSQCDYGIGVSSGTDALLVALMALDIGPGDEVITTPYTFFATGGVIARVGARPMFCDIEPVTYNLSPDALADLIKEQCHVVGGTLINRRTGGLVKALVPVHLYGQVADMEPLMAIAREYNLRVVEDAAQAIGAEYRGGGRAGSIGDIGCFSFFPSKNLGAFGDGGMCTTNELELAERLRALRIHGGKPKYYHSLIGGNFRLDEIQAAVLVVKLKYLDRWTERRQRNAQDYDQAFTQANIQEFVATPQAVPRYRHIYNQYVIRAVRRDELRAHLAVNKIGTEIYYPIPLHLQKCFEYLGYKPGDCPESERAANETLAIPIYAELTQLQRCHVVRTITQFYR
ncbi:MAG: DegT/DnrJ/EryC1/StrS family aminotransferase [Gammaproteobacteria bacterium]|nr:DegT/DnrJ/EryC1/StrS family aminotransferase [Gammaproteobacteria bacterium]